MKVPPRIYLDKSTYDERWLLGQYKSEKMVEYDPEAKLWYILPNITLKNLVKLKKWLPHRATQIVNLLLAGSAIDSTALALKTHFPIEFNNYAKRWVTARLFTVGELAIYTPKGLRAEPEPITINSVPYASHELSLAKYFLNYENWRILRRKILDAAHNRCEFCGSNKGNMECNEHWEYMGLEEPNAPKIQRLGRLECLCHDCHMVVHYLYARSAGEEQRAYQQMELVNGWSMAECDAHIDEAQTRIKEKTKYAWQFDLSLLFHYGFQQIDRTAEELVADSVLLTQNSPFSYSKMPRVQNIVVTTTKLAQNPNLIHLSEISYPHRANISVRTPDPSQHHGIPSFIRAKSRPSGAGPFWKLRVFIGHIERRFGKSAPLFITIMLMGIMFLWLRLL